MGDIPSNDQVDANSPVSVFLMQDGFRDNLGATIGSITAWYDFNGTLGLPKGYMLCDGSQINEAGYDAQHSSGAWDDDVGLTALEDKYTPNQMYRTERI